MHQDRRSTSIREMSEYCVANENGQGIYSDFGLQLRGAPRDVLSSLDSLLHPPVDGHPIGSPKHRARAQESQWVVLCASIVDSNIPQHVLVDLLGEVDADAEEISYKEYISHCSTKVSDNSRSA